MRRRSATRPWSLQWRQQNLINGRLGLGLGLGFANPNPNLTLTLTRWQQDLVSGRLRDQAPHVAHIGNSWTKASTVIGCLNGQRRG